MRWVYNPLPSSEIESLSRQTGVSPILAELLLRSGLSDQERTERFLRPRLAELGDPFLLHNLRPAVERLVVAIQEQHKIVVLGDYDVDGVSSTALLVSILRRFGLTPHFVVPRRMEDGYGLSRSAIDRALEEGKPDLFIALDCGTNSIEEANYLREIGVDLLIVDHHRSKDEQIVDGILINPHAFPLPGDDDWRNLCTVGLVFKLVHGLIKELRRVQHPGAHTVRLREYLDFVAMGTIADLVPLRGENRIMARVGLTILAQADRPGLRALMRVAGIRLGQEIQPVDISFRLGPRINASGRLADAALSVELLLSTDEPFARRTADQLEAYNRERQEIERGITTEAERLIDTHYSDWPGIVLFDEAWHPGVVGIVAGRVTRKYNRPCVVLGNEGDLAKGSGRSITGINLVKVLGTCCEDLSSWGGHPMAVGIAVPKDKLEHFRAQFADAVRTAHGDETAEREVSIAAWLPIESVRERLMDELDTLRPFGQANPQPVFGLKGIVLRRSPDVFKAQHIRFQLEDSLGRRLYGVGWKMADRVPPSDQAVDLAVELNWNHFNGRKLLQLELVDWRLSGS